MALQFRIPQHMIIPFACPKWEIGDIAIEGVSTDGTYFRSDTHCVHINKAEASALRLSHLRKAWSLDLEAFEVPGGFDQSPEQDMRSALQAISNVEKILLDFGNLQTASERLFVQLYMKSVRELWSVESNRLDMYDRPKNVSETDVDFIPDPAVVT